jgi:hypothetical protein
MFLVVFVIVLSAAAVSFNVPISEVNKKFELLRHALTAAHLSVLACFARTGATGRRGARA